MTEIAEPADAADEGAAEERGRKRRHGPLMFLRDLVVILLIAILVSFLLKTFLVRAFYIPSGSMENTLRVNDRILVDQLTPLWNDYTRGEIVVFKDPGGWLPVRSAPPGPPLVEAFEQFLTFIGLGVSDSEDHLVKRVIGLPGDRVVCCNSLGQIEINGAPIDESAYLKLVGDETQVSRQSFDVTVPQGALWVLGDNRHRSQDSRAHQEKPGGGFVPMENVVGRAFVVIWPLTHLGGMDAHSELFNGVPDPR